MKTCGGKIECDTYVYHEGLVSQTFPHADRPAVPVGVSYLVAKGVVVGTIIAELYLGIILVWRLNLKFGLGVAMALMLGFTAYLWYLSTLADPPKCGCLGLTGMFNSSKHEALFGVFRNCVILWALKLTMDYHFKPAEPARTGAVAA